MNTYSNGIYREGPVLVLGGDGFCGWPTSLYLSQRGYDVIIVDNLSRRKIDVELGCQSLTPIATIEKRLSAWQEVTGQRIGFANIDIAADYEQLRTLLAETKPQAVVHFAEQRAAPYSMKSSCHKRYTVNNNTNGTHNLLCAIVETGLDVHLGPLRDHGRLWVWHGRHGHSRRLFGRKGPCAG